MRIAIPDFVSNSYFPAIAAVELGFMREEGVDAELELHFPVTDAAHGLRDGRFDFLAGAAHAPLYAFPNWEGAKLVSALSQNMYWFLVVRDDLLVERGDVSVLRDVNIGAAAGVGEGLRQLLEKSGVDIDAAHIRIAPVPGMDSASVSFGVTAAEALANGRIDGFWANGMGAEVAVRSGAGKVIVDARRDGEPGASFTFPALSTTQKLIDEQPDIVAGAVRAIVRAQQALRADPTLSTGIVEKLYPALEATLIAKIVERDTPFYDATISEPTVAGLVEFARGAGLLTSAVSYDNVVAGQFAPLWAAEGATVGESIAREEV
jgi:NitT/TauT family transport system substrate-binding protein